MHPSGDGGEAGRLGRQERQTAGLDLSILMTSDLGGPKMEEVLCPGLCLLLLRPLIPNHGEAPGA